MSTSSISSLAPHLTPIAEMQLDLFDFDESTKNAIRSYVFSKIEERKIDLDDTNLDRLAREIAATSQDILSKTYAISGLPIIPSVKQLLISLVPLQAYATLDNTPPKDLAGWIERIKHCGEEILSEETVIVDHDRTNPTPEPIKKEEKTSYFRQAWTTTLSWFRKKKQ